MKISLRKLSKVYLLILLYFCAQQQVSAQCIGVVTAGVNEFWNGVINGAQKAAQELDIALYARGATEEENVSGQHYIIDQVINKEGCNGLLLAPNNKEHLKYVALLKQKGIPTVYVDRDIGGARVSVIKTNNAYAGMIAGQAMVKELNGKGNIAILKLQKGVITTDIREMAFMKEVIKGGLQIKVNDYLGSTVGKARANAFNLLEGKENIDGIFTSNEITTIAAIKALEALGKSGKITHIGFDSHKLFIDSLKKNVLNGFVIQDPFQMGYQGIHTLYKAMKGEKVKENVTTNSIYINRQNINHIDIQKQLRMNGT